MATQREPRLRGMRAVLDRFASKRPAGEEHNAWHALLREATSLTERAEALHDLRATRDPTQTDAAHTKRVLTGAAKYAKDADAALDRMNRAWGGGASDLAARIEKRANLIPPAEAAEIRDLWRRTSSTEQAKLLTKLIEQNRGPEFAAIVRASEMLTGMQSEARKRYEQAFISRHAPEEVAAQEALMEAFDTARVIVREAQALAAAYSDPAKLEAITRAENAAAAAQQRFNAPS